MCSDKGNWYEIVYVRKSLFYYIIFFLWEQCPLLNFQPSIEINIYAEKRGTLYAIICHKTVQQLYLFHTIQVICRFLIYEQLT